MERVLHVTKALSDGNRLRALMLLRGGELCVCRLISLLKLAPSTVSKHMSILKQAGLVETRREGKWTYYKLSAGTSEAMILEIVAWVEKHLEKDPIITSDKLELMQSFGCEGGEKVENKVGRTFGNE